jgi:hypothetical protein
LIKSRCPLKIIRDVAKFLDHLSVTKITRHRITRATERNSANVTCLARYVKRQKKRLSTAPKPPGPPPY